MCSSRLSKYSFNEHSTHAGPSPVKSARKKITSEIVKTHEYAGKTAASRGKYAVAEGRWNFREDRKSFQKQE